MKKIFLSLSLMLFVGTVGTNVYAATTDNVKIIKVDDKKKKKKSNKACCSAEKTAATGSCSKSAGAKPTCCSKK